MPAKKISSKILELRGSYDRHPERRRKHEPTPPPARPAAPDTLSDAARVHWEKLVELLHDAGIMTALDSDALAAYCEAHARWLDATKKLADIGTVIKDHKGIPRHSPYLRVANDAFHQMRAMLNAFGLSPASRAGLSVAQPAPVENPFARIDRLRGA